MIIKIGDYQLPNVYVGLTFKESLDGELDGLTVIYDDVIKPPFNAHDIAIVDGKKWVVGSYHSELIARIPSKKYRTTLMLVELTKLLERYVIGPCSFTNPQDTLYMQFEKALDQAEVLRENEVNNFAYASAEFVNILGATPGEEFFFSSQMTLREVLDRMLSVLNYRVTVTDIYSNGNLVLGYRDLNRQSDDIKDLGPVVNEAESQDMEYLAQEYETVVRNALSKDRRVMMEEWQSVKPISLGAAGSEEFRLVVSNPIEEIVKVEMIFVGDVKWGAKGDSGVASETEYLLPFEVDITDLFVEQEVYATMPIREQEKYIPYTRGSREIGIFDTFKRFLFTQVKLDNKVREAWEDPATKEQVTTILAARNPNFDPSIYEVKALEFYSTGAYIDLYLYRVTYVPYLDLHYSQTKENADLSVKSAMISNQQDEAVEVGRYANNLRTLANKLGNKIYEVDVNVSSKVLPEVTCPTCNGTGAGDIREEMCDVCNGVGHIIVDEMPVLCGACGGDGRVVYTDACKTCDGDGIIESRPKTGLEMVGDLLNLGDRIEDDYTLISREYSIYNNFVKCHYVFIQHFSNVLTARLSRERRLYRIPIENIIDRDVLLKDYLILSTQQNQINDGILRDLAALTRFLRTFTGENVSGVPIERLVFTTSEAGGNVYSLPLRPTAIGKTMHWQARCHDNFSVGLSAGEQTVGGREVYLNPYVDENGEFAMLVFSLVKSNLDNIDWNGQLAIGKSLPKVPEEFSNNYKGVNYTGGDISIQVFKDRFERFGFCYQLEPIVRKADADKIIIGDSFAKYSNLLFGKNETPLYVWASQTESYRPSETKRCKGTKTSYRAAINSTNYSLTASIVPQSLLKSWAIGDADGNLILAVNNNFAYAYVYFTISRNMV